MTQQINLYDPMLLPQRPALTAGRVALLVCAVAVAIGGYRVYLASRLQHAEAIQAGLAARVKEAQEEIARFGRSGGQAKSGELEAAIAKADAELKIRQSVLARLQGDGVGNTRGFSDYMSALARQRLDGVWITGLSVAEGGSDFTIQGGATRPEILPEYIRRLNREEVLRGKQISDLRLQSRDAEVRAPALRPGQPAGGDQPGEGAGTSPKRWRFVEFSIGSGMRPPNTPAGG